MPSRRSRSRSRDRRPRRRDYSRDRSRSRSPEHRIDLPNHASPISESDYFKKFDELRLWLKEEKGKYINELTSDKTRSYFRKFVKAWNRGKLSLKYYEGLDSSSVLASEQTGYKWNFTSNQTRADGNALRSAREEISAATNARDSSSHAGSSSSGTRVLGPTLPSASDLTLAREFEVEREGEERRYKRKRDKMEAKDRVEDMVGPKSVGREAMLEKKQLRRDNDRAFRERGDDGLDMDESTTMGGGDSFKDRIAKRDAAKRRFEHKAEEKNVAIRERANAIREKEKATMDMFQQLAKQRFG
ncbi:hypothetical protein AGABI1DRAFT_110827 [Agaricus bisporus var. burnettii JB137-S8]|uniref:Splicing arginine serine-rich 12 n=1 Tax=Agaricus bisporus var. burnettii (strain JB137-S8 / ATCC MYA-4627 / FGSC 10392) TaxID=597362 RepID=K5WBI5_AGABU|nr:uncharacterized protein AGABI1DRAFT_110827 [Agaricus bisporus var. burnettii JB137-S8]EKM84269.1 hypothetical protein AGABI1DRAFT_110827 [Agaricus bisporus var. burnettii JB137-S8]